MTDDRIRVSDADRERVAAGLREHFAEGRLSLDELDERIAAALTAKTLGDVRRVMADLPDPMPAPPQARPSASWAPGPGAVFRRGPRLVPLAVLALIAALVIPGAGWLFPALVQLVLALWLAACLAGIFAAAGQRRHIRRRQSGHGPCWHLGRYHGRQPAGPPPVTARTRHSAPSGRGYPAGVRRRRARRRHEHHRLPVRSSRTAADLLIGYPASAPPPGRA
jgi:hypothetical protein